MQNALVPTGSLLAFWDRRWCLRQRKGKERGTGKEKKEAAERRHYSSAELMWLTVCLQLPRLTAAAACLVDGLDDEDVLGATLQTVYSVVVLLDVGHNHPAIRRVTETCKANQVWCSSLVQAWGNICIISSYLNHKWSAFSLLRETTNKLECSVSCRQ